MNEWALVAVIIIGVVAMVVGYIAGVNDGLKNLKIREVEIERDMYKQRLQEWKSKE